MPQLDTFVWFDGAASVAILFAFFQFGCALLFVPFVVRNWVLATFTIWQLRVLKGVKGYRLLRRNRFIRFLTFNKVV